MHQYVTAAPHGEPPATGSESVTPPAACTSRPDLHTGHRTPHHTLSPRHASARARRGGVVASPERSAGTPPPPLLDPDCRRFTEFALRAVLEVLDRRRHAAGLAGILDPTPLDLVTALARAGTPHRRLGGASLRGVHLRHVETGRAEVFGTYQRGARTFAIAGRVEHRPRSRAQGRPTAGWTVTSLQVG